MPDLLAAVLWIVVVSIPLSVSVWALLDAARRPEWVWALAGRRQTVWLAAILFGILSVVPGLFISATYLARIRPILARAEQGQI